MAIHIKGSYTHLTKPDVVLLLKSSINSILKTFCILSNVIFYHLHQMITMGVLYSPLHVSVHCRLFFVQSVQEASAFTYSKCHNRRSQRSPSSNFVHSLARYTATDASRSNHFRWPPVTYRQTDGWTPHNYYLNIIMMYIQLHTCTYQIKPDVVFFVKINAHVFLKTLCISPILSVDHLHQVVTMGVLQAASEC